MLLTLGFVIFGLRSLVIAQPKPSPTSKQSSSPEQVRTLDFCRLIRLPYGFLNQTVRITAKWEIAGEFQFLNGIDCRSVYLERIRTGFTHEQDSAIKWNLSRVQSREFDSRAMITVVGALRDPTPGNGPAALQFEIFRFENITALEGIRDVDFCDIVRQPQRFFGQAVRIKALWQAGFEFSYLQGVGCTTSFRDEISPVFLNSRDPNISKLMTPEYGGRAIITAAGTLRDSGNHYGYFRYLFDIHRLEDLQHVITPYEGTLDAGKTYRAVVRGDKEFGLLLVPTLRNEFHYAVRIEWRNLSEFPPLERLHETSGERTVVFSVMADERKQIDVQRWNRALECKIIRIE